MWWSCWQIALYFRGCDGSSTEVGLFREKVDTIAADALVLRSSSCHEQPFYYQICRMHVSISFMAINSNYAILMSWNGVPKNKLGIWRVKLIICGRLISTSVYIWTNTNIQLGMHFWEHLVHAAIQILFDNGEHERDDCGQIDKTIIFTNHILNQYICVVNSI